MRFFYIFIFMLLISFDLSAKISFEAGVNTEATDQNSGLAKKTALNKAYREAFLKVSSRLTSAQNVQTLDNLTDDQLSHFIREVEVVAEKMTSTSYRADLNIKINENLLKQYLAENNMLTTSDIVSKALIIPIYSNTEQENKLLFEDSNSWREAWMDKGYIKSGNIEFDIIQNTEKNSELINLQNIDSIDNNTYDKLRFVNGAEDIFIINAIKAGSDMLVVSIKSFPKNYHKSFIINGGNIFDKAIDQALSNMTYLIQNRTETLTNQDGQIDVFFETKITDWLATEKKLNDIAQVKKVYLKSFSLGKAVFTIEFSSGIDDLIEVMARNGLYLQITNGIYTLMDKGL